MKILIAGAGIGGLTAALCLARSGHKICVLEQSVQFREVGAGIQCGANALQVFDYLGLLPALELLSVAPERVEFKDYQTGAVLYQMPLGNTYRNRFDKPYWNLHRADILSVLRNAVQTNKNIEIHLNTKLESYSELPEQVQVNTNQGSFSGELLIGADGIHSKVRALMYGKHAPIFTGNLAWRAVVPVERLRKNWMPTIVSNFVGPKKHAVLYYLRNKELANLVGVVENSNWQDSSWMTSAPLEELHADFAGWHSTLRDFIEVIDPSECYRWALHDHKALDSWHSSRTVLLGDAAHASLPFMAAGGAMAIEDARVLDRALSKFDSLSDALACYQSTRLPRASKIQGLSRKAGSLYHFQGSFMRRAAFMGMKLMAKKNEYLLPSYNANIVKLS